MDMPYSMIHWIAFFFIYGFLGWCYESAYVSIKHKQWVNRGFVRGPLLPLYGSGAILLLFVTIPFRKNLFLMFVSGAIGATILEYITGVAMEALFKVRYWDYSKRKFNFQGHICLAATTLWGVFAIVIAKVVHRPIENLVMGLPETIVEIFVMVVTVVFAADFALSFKAAMDIRDVLIKLEEVQREMERMQKRLDVILAFAEDSREQVVMNTYERLDELTDALEERFARVKELREKLDAKIEEEWKEFTEDIKERSEDRKIKSEERKVERKEKSEAYKEELEELIINFRVATEKRFQLLHRKDFFRRDMIRSNPSMVSKQFKEALEDVKRAAKEAVEEMKKR